MREFNLKKLRRNDLLLGYPLMKHNLKNSLFESNIAIKTQECQIAALNKELSDCLEQN